MRLVFGVVLVFGVALAAFAVYMAQDRIGQYQSALAARDAELDKKLVIDYKEPKTLRLFLTETGKLIPRRISGNCAKHQRPLALAVKRSRQVALLPYSTSHV